jgi:hypothetical protein
VAKIAFNDASPRSIAAPEKGQTKFWDDKLPAFGIRVSQGGSKTFVLKRDNTFITLGRCSIISLAKARDQAKRLLAEFTLGVCARSQSRSIKRWSFFLQINDKAAEAEPLTTTNACWTASGSKDNSPTSRPTKHPANRRQLACFDQLGVEQIHSDHKQNY